MISVGVSHLSWVALRLFFRLAHARFLSAFSVHPLFVCPASSESVRTPRYTVWSLVASFLVSLVFKLLPLPWLGLRVLSALPGPRFAMFPLSFGLLAVLLIVGSYRFFGRTRARDSDKMILTGPS